VGAPRETGKQSCGDEALSDPRIRRQYLFAQILAMPQDVGTLVFCRGASVSHLRQVHRDIIRLHAVARFVLVQECCFVSLPCFCRAYGHRWRDATFAMEDEQ
jgi:hypothetical protein